MKRYRTIRFLIMYALILPIVSAFLGNNFPITTNPTQEFNLIITKGEDLVMNKTGVIENYYVPSNKINTITINNKIIPQESFLRSNDYRLIYSITDKASNKYTKILNFTYTSYPPELINIPTYYINGIINGTIKNGNKVEIAITRLDNKNNIVASKEIQTNNNFRAHFTLDDGLYLVSIKGENSKGYTKVDRIMFVDHIPPKVEIGVEDGEVINNYLVLSPIISDNFYELKPMYINIELEKEGSTIYKGNLSEGFFLAKKLAKGSYKLKVNAKDKAGNIYSKVINFNVIDGIKPPILYKDNKILPKYIWTHNTTFTATIKPTSTAISLNGQNIPTNAQISIHLKDGENELTLIGSDGSKIKYILTKTPESASIELCNLTKINSKTIIANNTIITKQREFLVCGNSSAATYVNNVKVTKKGPFYRYIYLSEGENNIEIETERYKKNLSIIYIPEFTEIVNTNLKSLVSNPTFSFKINLTEIGTPLFIYLNGELKSITIPKIKTIEIGLSGLKPGLNIVEVKTISKELLFKPVIFDDTTLNVNLTSPTITPTKGIVFRIGKNFGINLDETELMLTNNYGVTKTIKGDKIKLLGDYIVFDTEGLSKGSYSYNLILKTLSGKKVSKTGIVNVRDIFITEITDKITNKEVPFFSGLLFLSSTNLDIEFNKDIIVKDIKIDNFSILNYKLLGNKIEIEIPEELIKDKGKIELTVGDKSLNEYTYNFIYYSKKYKSKVNINYIPDYISINNPVILGDIESEICNWSSVTINNDNTPQKFGRIFIANVYPAGPLYIKACNLYLDECTEESLNTLFEDNTKLNLNLVNDKNSLECHVNNIDVGEGNLITLEEINGIKYNIPLSSVSNLTPPISYTDPSMIEVKVKENSGREYKVSTFLYDPDKGYLLEELKNGVLYLSFVNPFTSISFYKDGSKISYGIDESKKIYSLGLDENGNYTIITPEFVTNLEFSGAACNNKLPQPIINVEGEDVKIKVEDTEEIEVDSINMLGIVNNNSIDTNIVLPSGTHAITLFRKGECGSTVERYLVYTKPTISAKVESSSNKNNTIIIQSNIPVKKIESEGEEQEIQVINNDINEYIYETITPPTKSIEITTPQGVVEEEVENKTITYTNLSLVLNSISNNNLFQINGIYVTNLKDLTLNGKVNKEALVKVYVNDKEMNGILSSDNFSIYINLSDLITDRDSMELKVQLKAQTPFQKAESNILTVYFKRILSAIVSVIIG